MGKVKATVSIPDENILSRIYVIRGEKVMLDRDLAELYDVNTKVLKQQVKRNINRFPKDFMFQLSKNEFEDWRSQFVTSNSDRMGLRHTPFAFTEQGVAMLSSILNSERAINTNIQIIRLFTKMRKLILSQKHLYDKIVNIEKRVDIQDGQISGLFELIEKSQEMKPEPRKKIGFKIKGEE